MCGDFRPGFVYSISNGDIRRECMHVQHSHICVVVCAATFAQGLFVNGDSRLLACATFADIVLCVAIVAQMLFTI